MRLSERMKLILEVLARWKLNSSVAEAKQRLIEYREKAAPFLMQLGDTPPLGATDEEATQEYMTDVSATVKDLILILETDISEKSKAMQPDNAYGGIDSKFVVPGYNPDFRHFISLTETISGKYYPKGRQGWHGRQCGDYDDYWDSYFLAQTLYASYTRTVKKLERLDLVALTYSSDRSAKRYYITDNGLSVLTKYRTLNTSREDKA
jgi:hypothetical protein